MFKAAFIIYYSQIWKQPKCPSIGEWIKKMHVHTHTRTHTPTHKHAHIHTMGHYSAIEKNELLLCNDMDELGGYYAY